MFFVYRLALALKKTVAELLATMDSDEFTHWIAFDRLSPIGDERADLRAGIIASTVANCHRSPNRDPFRPSDFMVEYGKKKDPSQQTQEDVDKSIDDMFAPFVVK